MTTGSEPCVGGEVTWEWLCGVLNDNIIEVEGDATKKAQYQHHQQHLVWFVFLLKYWYCFTFLCISLWFAFCICIMWLRQILHKPPGVSCLPCNNLSCGLFNLIIELHLLSPTKCVYRHLVGQLGREQVLLSGHNTRIPTVDKTPLIKYLKIW